MTYFGKWDFVEGKENIVMARRFYMAPGECLCGEYQCVIHCLVYFFFLVELSTLSEPTVAVDWWCLGTFLFELLTGTVYTDVII